MSRPQRSTISRSESAAKIASAQTVQKIFEAAKDLYFSRNGVKEDKARAAELFVQAARHGRSEAQYMIGFMLANGQGVEKDESRAFKLYEQAALQGNATAQFIFGLHA